jgi:hypothetical protein
VTAGEHAPRDEIHSYRTRVCDLVLDSESRACAMRGVSKPTREIAVQYIHFVMINDVISSLPPRLLPCHCKFPRM